MVSHSKEAPVIVLPKNTKIQQARQRDKMAVMSKRNINRNEAGNKKSRRAFLNARLPDPCSNL
jgi:hypothetical protein